MRRKDQAEYAVPTKEKKASEKRPPDGKAPSESRQVNKNKADPSKTKTHHSDTKRKADFEASNH
jgi:hypothetical protein